MLVEEARVEVEDPLADDVEAEVAGLDDAGVDRADRDLIDVLAAYGHRPVGEHRIVLDEWPQRLVAVEVDAVEIVCLALVPVGGRGEIDDRRHHAGSGRDGLDRDGAVRRDERSPDDGSAFRGVEAGEAGAAGEGLLHGLAVREGCVDGHPSPLTSASTMSVSGSQNAAPASTSRIRLAAAERPITARSPGASARSRRRVLPPVVSTSAWASPTNPSASRAAAPAAAHGCPASKPPATMRISLSEERRRRQPGERPEREAHGRAEGRLGARDACDGVAGRAWLVPEQRRRGVEAECLRDRMPDDVHGDAGERDRRRESDPERDHAHVLEARVGEQPLPGERPPQEGDGDGQRQESEADQHDAPRVGSDRRLERALDAPGDEQHCGQEGGGEQCRHGRRRLGVSVGQPVVHRRPADLGREPDQNEQECDQCGLACRHVGGQRAPRQQLERPARRDRRQQHDPEQGEAESERGEEQVLPAGLERARLAAQPHEDRRGGRRRLDQQPRSTEIAGQRHRREHGDECRQRGVVGTRTVRGAEEPRRSAVEVRRRGDRARESDEPDHADHQPARRVDHDPVGHLQLPGIRERHDREHDGGETREAEPGQCDRLDRAARRNGRPGSP